jgi:polyhydroxybutyrate depolymerase
VVENAAAAIVEFILGPLTEDPHRVGHALRRELARRHSAHGGRLTARFGVRSLLLAAVLAGACATWSEAGVRASTARAAPSVSSKRVPKLPLAPGTSKTFTVVAGGHRRTYIVHAPKTVPPDRLAVVLAFHGAGDTAAGMEQETGLDATADAHGFLAVYPQGYENTWNEGAGHTPAEQAGIDDVAFTAALIAQLERTFPVDPGAIAATGFSNGALLAEYLGCRLASSLAVIAPVAGPLPASVSARCRPSRPVSVLAFHGTADTGIPYGGGPFPGVGGGTTVLSAPDSAARWARLDRCARQKRSSPAGAGYEITAYGGCARGASVALYTLVGGPHAWPQARGLDANAVLWSFLRAHRR